LVRHTKVVAAWVGTPRCGVRLAQRADPTGWGGAPNCIRIHNMWIVRLALRRPYSFTTMAQVEVQVPNHDGKLYAGMYGQVKFLLVDENAPLVVPANAFLFRTAGPQVATLGNEDRIHWQNIRVGCDFGDRIEVLDGLQENTKVVMNPTDDLREGIQVEVKSTEESKPASTVAQSTSNR
jgi:hypothetical protein